MRRGLLSDYFEGVAVKRMSAVEADPKRSHQHEFQGGHIRKLIGDDDRLKLPARFISGSVTSRKASPKMALSAGMIPDGSNRTDLQNIVSTIMRTASHRSCQRETLSFSPCVPTVRR
jgi:hypothetical protein